MTDAEETIVIGMGEMSVARGDTTVLVCMGLGSCVALCVYDPVSRARGMAHIVLPQRNGREDECSAKYADVAVPLLLREMHRSGTPLSRLVVKIAGGSKMSSAAGLNGIFQIGERNVAAVREAIAGAGIALAAADTGGHRGRTVRMHPDLGRVVVTTLGQESKEL
ncbi:MAG: chemotaxis protein CheD [Dehalococcoidia bacterium]|nr:chemotaxis protein CheD [Dehalococcoidia bacterium]